MNVVSAIVAAAPQFFCDVLGRVPSCETGVRRAFIIGLCGCALLALWTVNRHRNRSALSRMPGEDTHDAVDAVDGDTDDVPTPRATRGDVDDGASEDRDQVQRRWTESVSKDSESSTDLKEDDGNDDDKEDMRACRRWAKTHEDKILSAAHEADPMLDTRVDAEKNTLALGDDDKEEEDDDDDNDVKDNVGHQTRPETIVAAQQLPPCGSSAMIAQNGQDARGDDGDRPVADKDRPAVPFEHDALGQRDGSAVWEASCDGSARDATDAIVARWSARGLSVHASWAPAYADTFRP
ncbi:hypothetical protein psal_cds_231 [Pandoravirus salinus]|uniref:Uncharacterized protein n=1 Tax=Pandoravirus salinus TaxID=1349410 RepID=S4VWF4_9VIRU|nr:hypothetical protein psal_cds_231 [Pandoravirus salinus]AGO83771.1 hypothetical protein psal_cds_231 [Pandoravirus salinus]